MSANMKITTGMIRGWIDGRSLQRGQKYYRQDAILQPRVQENTLHAQCYGSMPTPYRLWVQLDDGIAAADCSCPVGSGGRCKHVAALLLTWLHQPDIFMKVDSLDAILNKKTKADLVALIKQMAVQLPELADMIVLSAADTATKSGGLSAELVRRQVQQAITHGDYGHDYYGAVDVIARQLTAVLVQGEQFAQREAWQDALTVFTTLIDELMTQYEQIYDHDGELIGIVFDATEQIGNCLPNIEAPATRRNIFRTLVDVHNYDIVMGGYGFADGADEIVLTQATPEEKAEIAGWVQETLAQLPADREFGTNWKRQAHGRFLLDLQMDTLDDDAYIQVCRRTGRVQELVQRLLELNRVEEAIADAQQASDFELLSLANRFVEQGHGRIAEGLVWERTAISNDGRLDDWLQQRAIENGDWEQALTYAESQFWKTPSLERYDQLHEICANMKAWPEKREVIHKRLAANGRHDLLTRIHLRSDDVAAALAALRQVKQTPFWDSIHVLNMDVAEAAEESFPHEAIRLYRQAVTRLIGQRGRSNYALAAEKMLRLQELYGRLGEQDAWQALLDETKNQKPRLPALLDELRQVGL